MRSDELKRPIAEAYGKSTFLKVKNDYFAIGKVLFSFVQWKEKAAGSQVERQVNCCLDVDEAMLFALDVISGRVQQRLAGLKDDEFAWKSQIGGVHEKEAAQKGLRSDGKAVARYFGIQTSKSQYCRFSAFQCAAHTAENGLIVPERGGAVEAVTVPVATEEALRVLACGILRNVAGYAAGLYASCYGEVEGEREALRRGDGDRTPEAPKESEDGGRELTLDCYWSVPKGSVKLTRGAKNDATILRMIVPRIGDDEPLDTDERWQVAEVVFFEKALAAEGGRTEESVRDLIKRIDGGSEKGVLKALPLTVGEVRGGVRQLVFRGRR